MNIYIVLKLMEITDLLKISHVHACFTTEALAEDYIDDRPREEEYMIKICRLQCE